MLTTEDDHRRHLPDASDGHRESDLAMSNFPAGIGFEQPVEPRFKVAMELRPLIVHGAVRLPLGAPDLGFYNPKTQTQWKDGVEIGHHTHAVGPLATSGAYQTHFNAHFHTQCPDVWWGGDYDYWYYSEE